MFFEPTFLAIQFLNGLQLASLLFLLSVGLSVVYGLMNFINLAHGTLYMLGAYIGLTVARESGSFWLALVGAPLAIAALGALFHVLLLRRMQAASPMKQVLVTFGLIFIGLDVVRYIWGFHPFDRDAGHFLRIGAVVRGGVSKLSTIRDWARLVCLCRSLSRS